MSPLCNGFKHGIGEAYARILRGLDGVLRGAGWCGANGSSRRDGGSAEKVVRESTWAAGGAAIFFIGGGACSIQRHTLSRCPAEMLHTSRSMPDSGPGFHVKAFQIVACSPGSGQRVLKVPPFRSEADSVLMCPTRVSQG